MITHYKTLLRTRSLSESTRAALTDTVFAHARRNKYGYPDSIRWQELFDDLNRKGLLSKPGTLTAVIFIESWETYGTVLLPDGTPAGMYLVWYNGDLQAIHVFEIPERKYRGELERHLPVGTLLLQEDTVIPMHNADGSTSPAVLESVRRDPQSGLLLVKTRWTDSGTNEEFARDLPVADIYQILLAISPR